MTNKIKIIEGHFSNVCTYRCRICSKDYGGNNKPFADWDYVHALVSELTRDDDKRIECEVLQTGGCGDALLNTNFLQYLTYIRKELPNQKICLYTNFSLVTPQVADTLIAGKLLDQIQVRIDSFQSDLYKWSTTGSIYQVQENIKTFFELNDHIEFTFIYFPLYLYREAVRNKLHKEPTYFNSMSPQMNDEYKSMVKWFEEQPKKKPELFKHRRSGICYWAERKDVEPSVLEKCKHLPEHENTFNEILQLYPNGDCGLCAYDSKQDTFIYGNMFEQCLYDIWNSEYKKELIQNIRNGMYYGHFPCANARACDFDCL